MGDLLTAIFGAISTAFVLAGVYWQYLAVCRARQYLKTCIAPLVVAGVLSIGQFAFAFLQEIDGLGPDYDYALKFSIVTVVFALVFSVKLFFGPIILMSSAAWGLYTFATYGSIDWWSVYELFTIIFGENRTSNWAIFYTVTYFIYSLYVHIRELDLSDIGL